MALKPGAPLWLQREQRLYEKVRVWRDKLFSPLVATLRHLHITPTVVSVGGIVGMSLAAYLIGRAPLLGTLLVIAVLLLDIVDGPLARQTNQASDKGKFIDITSDNATFVIYVTGLVAYGFLGGVAGIALVYTISASTVMRVLRINPFFTSDWHFHPVAGSFPVLVRSTMYLSGLVAAYLPSIEEVNTIAFILAIIAAIDLLIQYRAFINESKI